jgi:hypothetical protein
MTQGEGPNVVYFTEITEEPQKGGPVNDPSTL